jgi:phosphatidylglycerol:prolipoprotein diacylglycerol transferase
MVAAAMIIGAKVLTAELVRQQKTARVGTASGGSIPEQIVPGLTIVVMVAGVAGARLFHIFENTESFAADPASMIFTRSGFSVFGGLILGTLAGLIFIHRHGLKPLPTLDAAAPSMMLGYAIGRIGCQISGDGDWGQTANMAIKPDWIPTWAWSQIYENNIAGVSIPLPGVYPTPLYEAAMCLLLFAILWRVRRHPFGAGCLFSLYLVLAGAERLLIEQIRINNQLQLGAGIQATQAEVIAAALILAGTVSLALLVRRSTSLRSETAKD